MEPNPSYNVLVVEDDDIERALILKVVSAAKTDVDEAKDGTPAINYINRKPYDLILLDLELPHVSGMEVLAHVKANANATPVIILTGSSDVRMAVEAMKYGAYDYLTKPFGADELTIAMRRALEFKTLRNSVAIIERSRNRSTVEESVIGASGVWLATLEKARHFAKSDSIVYLEGETGSGKEVLANYIHVWSERKEKPLVVVDCGAVTDSLIESELFGHKKGAFTGADSTKEGLVELANGGTLFLDEIGHIDSKFQQKLLKFVETKSFRRVGDTATRTVDVRIIAASNKHLVQEVEAGRFRSDLLYRLNVMKIQIPALRERPSDIVLLAEHFLRVFGRNQKVKMLSPEALAALESSSWPGNVRELQSAIQRAMVMSKDEVITPNDLEIEHSYTAHSNTIADQTTNSMSLREVEHRHIENVLVSLNWNISRAARMLGIGRTTLYEKIEAYSIRSRLSHS